MHSKTHNTETSAVLCLKAK